MGKALNTYVAAMKREIFDRLRTGEPPHIGAYDETVWKDAKDKGVPQMGTATFTPRTIQLEFIFRDPLSANLVLLVTLDAPERIVFMPVPKWVHQEVWQGEVDGTFRFESEAFDLLRELSLELSEEGNKAWFEKRLPTTRE